MNIRQPTFRTVVHNGGLDELPRYLAGAELTDGRFFILTDTNLRRLYLDSTANHPGLLTSILKSAGLPFVVLEMPPGEHNKTLKTASIIIESLANANASRTDTIIAFGGGVVGDLGGFVASIYNRGVPLVQVPTTLLAMVDSSIGGKTGVDHGGKNKTGSFYQPRMIISDPRVLYTLDERVYREGFGEIVKYAMLDATFMFDLESEMSLLRMLSGESIEALTLVIARCVKHKCQVVATDPYETAPDGRVLLNYGHTLGHGLEAAGGYAELLHGEAVSIGMSYEARLAAQLGISKPGVLERQDSLLRKCGLPTEYHGNASLEEIMLHIAKDKKNVELDFTRIVLPRAPGEMVLERLDNVFLRSFLNDLLSERVN